MSTGAQQAAISVELVPVTTAESTVAVRQPASRVRLFIVDPGAQPPSVGALDDWVRLPASAAEVAARVGVLAGKAWRHLEPPSLDRDDVLRYRTRWVALSPAEASVARVLLDHFGSLANHAELYRALSELEHHTNRLTVRIWRLRRRIEPLGLEIQPVRRRGYILCDTAERHDSMHEIPMIGAQ